MRYDLIVIGTGPGGRAGALAAAAIGKRVAVIEQQPQQLGGAAIHDGALPAKAFREAILTLTGYRHRKVYPELFGRRRRVSMLDVRQLAERISRQQSEQVEQRLQSQDVELLVGQARFIGEHDVELVDGPQAGRQVSADKILIATGSSPVRPSFVPFDGRAVFDTNELLHLDRLPRSLIVVGGGAVGLEYALMFAVLGVNVAVVDSQKRLWEYCDHETTAIVQRHAESLGVTFRFGQQVIAVERSATDRVMVTLENGKRLVGDSVLYAAGRRGNTDALNLAAAGIAADENGRVWCNEFQQTWTNHIYAAGDVVGFPARAGAAAEQAKCAVGHAFGQMRLRSKYQAYGISTIPELAMVGPTEEQLFADRVPYEVGVASYGDVARGHLSDDTDGLLKLLFHRDTHQLLAVHCVGDMATELIHLGQAVLSFGGTIEYFRDAVFHYPSFSECFKLAAENGLQNLDSDSFDDEGTVVLPSDSIFDDEETVFISPSSACVLSGK